MLKERIENERRWTGEACDEELQIEVTRVTQEFGNEVNDINTVTVDIKKIIESIETERREKQKIIKA